MTIPTTGGAITARPHGDSKAVFVLGDAPVMLPRIPSPARDHLRSLHTAGDLNGHSMSGALRKEALHVIRSAERFGYKESARFEDLLRFHRRFGWSFHRGHEEGYAIYGDGRSRSATILPGMEDDAARMFPRVPRREAVDRLFCLALLRIVERHDAHLD